MEAPPEARCDEGTSRRLTIRKRIFMLPECTQAPKTPEPVDGRKHIDVQTESYLEELTDRSRLGFCRSNKSGRPARSLGSDRTSGGSAGRRRERAPCHVACRLVEVDIETQTDAFMDRPASPLFVPMKTGVDTDTQIYDGDLFDFDYEVPPRSVPVCAIAPTVFGVMPSHDSLALRTHGRVNGNATPHYGVLHYGVLGRFPATIDDGMDPCRLSLSSRCLWARRSNRQAWLNCALLRSSRSSRTECTRC